MSTLTGIVLAIVVIGPMLVLMVLTQKAQHKERQQLIDTGTLGEAEIIGYDKDEYLYVHYRFTPMHADRAIECRKIIGTLDTQYPVGTKVAVRYQRQHPSISILVPYADSQIPTS